jgi:hypothetical protein
MPITVEVTAKGNCGTSIHQAVARPSHRDAIADAAKDYSDEALSNFTPGAAPNAR